MKITGILKQEVEIDTDPSSLVKTLIEHYFDTYSIESIIEKDGYLCVEYDVSVHGSPVYEYRKITKNPKKIKLFKLLKDLLINIEDIK